MVKEYLDPRFIFFLDTPTKEETIATMITGLSPLLDEEGKELFSKAVHQREELVSTGLGMGVAIPHAKLPILSDFFIAVAILSKGVDWGALDGVPVRLVVMIGGPANRPGDYLQILSRLTLALKAEERRKKILQVTTSQEIVDLLVDGV
jgi:PTS system nitrogen regulatory IIA component